MIYEDIFKPQTFDDYVGQEQAKQIIQVMLEASDREDKDIPNFLFTGTAGLGKTSLAKIILGPIPHLFIDGKSLKTLDGLPSFVIIDEVHNVKSDLCDSLNILIDDARIIIMGATTNPGQLPGPFRSRFQTINLIPYNVEQLVQIMHNVLVRKGTLDMDDMYLEQIAARSRQTPRTALKYLSFVMDLMTVNNSVALSQEILDNAFEMLGVDDEGLLEIDRKYLEAFPVNGQPVGIDYLTAVIAQDKETIEQEIEPYLMNKKLIDRTPRGRIRITDDSDAMSAVAALFGETI